MRVFSGKAGLLPLFVMFAGTAPVGLAAQAQDPSESEVVTTVYGPAAPDASQMAKGPEVEGIISARSGNRIQVTTAEGTSATVTLSDDTRIRAKGGFLGLDRDELAAASLVNGLPVRVETLQWEGGLVASRIELKNKDLKTAAMIHGGTNQRFTEQGTAIHQNAAATEQLRGRMGDLDQYNVKRTTNVHFGTDKTELSAEAKADLCSTASEAEGIDNALLLIVGYTDARGDLDYNQGLSERRAGRVVNHLQQVCGWKPYRMLTPTGMSEAEPVASNDTAEGMAQNRRVAVNILVSKGLEGL